MLIKFNGLFFSCYLGDRNFVGRITVHKGFIYLCNDAFGGSFEGVPKKGYKYQLFCGIGDEQSQDLAGVNNLCVSNYGVMTDITELL